MRKLHAWTPVSKNARCPICDKPDWCLVADDGGAALCQRVESANRIGDAGWLHKLKDAPIHPWHPKRPSAPVKPAADFDAESMAAWCWETITPQKADELAGQLGLDAYELWRLRMGWSEQHQAWTFPMRDAERNIIGIRLRGMDGRKWCVTGSRNGLFIPMGDILPAPLVVCEGPTDAAALGMLGFRCVGRPSNNGGADLVVQFVERNGDRDVVIVHDRDEPGTAADKNTREGALSLGVRLAAAGRIVRMLAPPQHKDVRDWVRAGATPEVVKAVIQQAKQVSKDAKPSSRNAAVAPIGQPLLGQDTQGHVHQQGRAELPVGSTEESFD